MFLDNYTDQIRDLCNKCNVRHLFAFGSVTTRRFSDQSDIDMLVDINSNDPIEYAEKYFELKFALQDLFNRRIDLLEERSLTNTYLRMSIDSSKKKIYGD